MYKTPLKRVEDVMMAIVGFKGFDKKLVGFGYNAFLSLFIEQEGKRLYFDGLL